MEENIIPVHIECFIFLKGVLPLVLVPQTSCIRNLYRTVYCSIDFPSFFNHIRRKQFSIHSSDGRKKIRINVIHYWHDLRIVKKFIIFISKTLSYPNFNFFPTDTHSCSNKYLFLCKYIPMVIAFINFHHILSVHLVTSGPSGFIPIKYWHKCIHKKKLKSSYQTLRYFFLILLTNFSTIYVWASSVPSCFCLTVASAWTFAIFNQHRSNSHFVSINS